MKITTAFIFCLYFSTALFSQFFDDFSDGDYTTNPSWIVNSGIFTVNTTFELQQVDTVAGTSQIYTPVAIGDTTTWEFYVRLEFSPSSSNYSKIYLSSTSTDFSGNLNGYFIRFGESGSNDAVELYQQNGTATSLLIRATDGAIATSPAQARLKITRSNTGFWQLWADYTGGVNYTLEGTAQDNTFPQGDFFGFYNKYTASRKDLFFFDSISIAPLFVDVTPPNLVEAIAPTATTIDVRFSEPLNQSSAENVANFNLSSIGTPATATLDNTDATLVHLTLTSPLQNNQTYTLTATNVEDLAGNPMPSEGISFTFLDIQPAIQWEVLINEFMADPSPQVALPNAEYVELYNNSNKTIDLSTLTFSNGGTPVSLHDSLLLPNEYIIVCDDGDAAFFENFGRIMPLSSKPSLVNSGDDLTLAHINGNVIHQVSYTTSWYQDASKSSGGWSLELINPSQVCTGSGNWIASNHPSGGTPGQVNSVFSNTPDVTAPQFLQVTASQVDTLFLFFNENLELATAENIANYAISPTIGQPIAAELGEDLKTIKLTLATNLQDQAVYTLTINGVTDCIGNSITNQSITFTYIETEAAIPFDIIINEIMADPSPVIGLPEAEYVELYNRSNKAINLENFEFSNQSNTVLLPAYILLPNAYVIIYSDVAVDFGVIGDALLVEGLPILGNSSDELTLYNTNGEQIDYVPYESSWYQNSSKSSGGWSLERIFIHQPCIIGAANWQASENLSGGTPSRENSVASTALDEQFPDLLRAFPVSDNLVTLYFSESLDAASANTLANYSMTPSVGITAANVLSPSFDKVLLTLDAPLLDNTIYTITINDVKDCQGNAVGQFNTAQVGLPDSIQYRDIIVNELLFNPVSGGSDFVELYNRSDKILNIGDLLVGNMGPVFPDVIIPISEDRLIFPEEYIVLTENEVQVKNHYVSPAVTQFVEHDIPSYNDDEGGIILLSQGRRIDLFFYNEDMHHPLLDDEDGVSLERISPEDSTLNDNNWHSASATVGYATPGYQNSQFMNFTNQGSELITLPNITFSPDDDGFEDLLFIQYDMDEPGYLARLDIYDSKGRLVKNLANGELFGISGQLNWDGTTNEQTKARLGIYVIWIELTHPNGTVRYEKKTCVLAGRL